MEYLFTAIISLILTYLGVEAIRRWSLKRNLFDVPNSRSSHTVPTPRGGGAAIVIFSLIGYLISAHYCGVPFYYSFFFGSIAIAAISWIDDLFSVSFAYRLAVHSLTAMWVIYEIGYFNGLVLPFHPSLISLDYFGLLLTFLWIVWTINAYNFMDGIDGIAGTQAFTAVTFYLLVCFWWGIEGFPIFLAFILGSVVGFLVHNWPPAKIFMGDTGSSFLGFAFSVLPIMVYKNTAPPQRMYLPILAIIFIWPFIFDTVITFIRRAINREPVWQAHRSHLYQRMTNYGFRHLSITVLYGVLSIIVSTCALLWIKYQLDYLVLVGIVLVCALPVALCYREVSDKTTTT